MKTERKNLKYFETELSFTIQNNCANSVLFFLLIQAITTVFRQFINKKPQNATDFKSYEEIIALKFCK